MIRPAVLSDADALGELQLACWHEAYGALAPPGTLDAETLEARVRIWTGLLERDMNVLVLEIDGVLDGFAGYGPARDDDVGEETGELYALYLRAVRQGVGLGRRLQDQALAPIVDGGASEAVVWTLEANERARRFYETSGWSPDDRVGSKLMQWGLPEVRYRRTFPVSDGPEGVTVAVTDHAVERFRQRVGSRRGGFDVKPEIAGRVSEAWAAGRVSTTPPPGADAAAARGSVYIRDLVDRGVIFVCRHDRASRELLVVTLWEDERFGSPRVEQRFTDALKDSDRALVDPGRKWRERRDS